jgi:hypothetical protein
MRKRTIIEINHTELEAIVNNHYGIKGYEFVETQECDNDSCHPFDVRAVVGHDAHDLEKLKLVREDKTPTRCNRVILRDLVLAGVLEPGEYLVDVSW